MATPNRPKVKRSDLAIKAAIRRKVVAMHKLACFYMRARFGIRKIKMPRILYKDHKEAWAYADHANGAITIDKNSLKHAWLIIDEIIPHEMAHWAMFRVNNFEHDREWKACALYLGSTASLTIRVPKARCRKKIYGVYTYIKKGVKFKVIGRPFRTGQNPVTGSRLAGHIKETYLPHKRMLCCAEEFDTYLNFH